MTQPPSADEQDFVAVIDQDEVTDEVRDIALKYDPVNRSGETGFHVTDDGELHIDDAKVMGAHRLIETKIPNDAIRIVPLPTATGELIHQYGDNGFRLYELPAPERGSVVGLLGRNGIGKSTALRILAGKLTPNFGSEDGVAWADTIEVVRGTTLQTHFERLRDDDLSAALKPQRVESIAGGDEPVRELLRGAADTLIESLDVETLLDRRLSALSGGERQRVAIAATLSRDAELYVIDEPSSFLDVGGRLDVARTIREHVATTGAAALVVDHDLAVLDLLADMVHVLYGEPGSFGVVSGRLSTRRGINQYLEGRLREDNVRIRPDAIAFPGAGDGRIPADEVILGYPELTTTVGEFTLEVVPGRIYAGESIGILGRNGLGKTTFVKLLAGELDPDQNTIPSTGSVSYKPQSLAADGEGTVRGRFAAVADLNSSAFQSRIRDPFDLEPLFERPLTDLSGGELQRVGVALCLAREAEVYLLDEPSAFLDVEARSVIATEIQRFAERTDRPVLVVDHDLFVIDRLADRVVVFDGTPGVRGTAGPPQSKRAGMNDFLADVGVTFRRDEQTGRPRVNEPGSTLDREQRRDGQYFYDE